MTDTFIDMTNKGRPKRYKTGRCYYCDHDRYPDGKLIDPSTDKNAIQTPRGDWMCGECNFEEVKKLLDMNKRGKIK
jgi:hypothetical protein